MDLWKVQVNTSSEAADAVSVVLEELGAIAIDVEDRMDVELKKRSLRFGEILDDKYIDTPAQGAIVCGYLDYAQYLEGGIHPFTEDLRKALLRVKSAGLDPGSMEIKTSFMQADEYLHAWKKDFHAFAVTSRIAIVPSWERDSWQGEEGQIPLWIDPGVAFGTGTHETTTLCLKELERLIRPDTHLLDVGTGTGILAIAAAKLGAKSVLAVDLDETAVRVAQSNIQDNGVSHTVTVIKSDLSEATGPLQFDIVLANLLADLIIRLLPEVKRKMKKGSVLVASGIILNQLPFVEKEFHKHGFQVQEVTRDSDWVAVRASWEG